MGLTRPAENFLDWWVRHDEEQFYKDMSRLYAIGSVALSHKKLSLKRKGQIQRLLEGKIDKRLLYHGRRIKMGDGTWRPMPARFDERNWKFYYKLKKELGYK